jgi:hypothetical protein
MFASCACSHENLDRTSHTCRLPRLGKTTSHFASTTSTPAIAIALFIATGIHSLRTMNIHGEKLPVVAIQGTKNITTCISDCAELKKRSKVRVVVGTGDSKSSRIEFDCLFLAPIEPDINHPTDQWIITALQSRSENLSDTWREAYTTNMTHPRFGP